MSVEGARQILPIRKKKITAVIPAYNEEKSVGGVIAELKALHLGGVDVDCVVVDDGSRDATSKTAAEAGAPVVMLPFNMGIGITVQTGFRYALEHGADLVIQVDGDGQHIPNEMEKLLQAMERENADVVSGSRFVEKASEGIESTTFLRWVAGRLLAFTIRQLTGQNLTDTTSGFRLFNRRAAEFIAHDYPDDYPEVEVLVILAKHGFKIVEVPVKMRSRKHGTSSITWSRSIYYVLKVLFASSMNSLRRRK